MKKTNIPKHPVLLDHLTKLRNIHTDSAQFRLTLKELSRFMAYEATRDLNLQTKNIETPMTLAPLPTLVDSLAVIAIMRAGNGMLDGVLEFLPNAKAGHIGIYRDKKLNSTVEYFLRLPNDLNQRIVLLLDPLLATGDTAVAAIKRLEDYNCKKIRLLSILAAPQGIEKIRSECPETEIWCVDTDPKLNEKGYLVPGLGDAGDRLYGTL